MWAGCCCPFMDSSFPQKLVMVQFFLLWQRFTHMTEFKTSLMQKTGNTLHSWKTSCRKFKKKNKPRLNESRYLFHAYKLFIYITWHHYNVTVQQWLTNFTFPHRFYCTNFKELIYSFNNWWITLIYSLCQDTTCHHHFLSEHTALERRTSLCVHIHVSIQSISQNPWSYLSSYTEDKLT